jgi:6-phosphogluconolactonase (cycloisomerase 2 family)
MFIRPMIALALLASAQVLPASDAPQFVYTANAQSMSGFAMDPLTGSLTPVPGSPFPEGFSDQGVVLHPSGRRLYFVGEGALIYVLGVATPHPVSGSQTTIMLLNQLPNGFYTIALDPAGMYLYLAAASAVSVFRVDSLGAVTPVPGSPFPTGSGGVALSMAVHPSGRFAYVANSAGTITAFQVNRDTGSLLPVIGSPFPTGGVQTKGVAVHPSGRFLYASNTNSDDVSAFRVDPANGALTSVAGSPFPVDGVGPGALAVDPTGRFLYCGNEGSDNVSLFGIASATGALSRGEGSPYAAGDRPLAMALDLKGRYLYVANNNSHNLSGYRLDHLTGSLTPVPGSPFAAGDLSPASITAGRDFTRGDLDRDGRTDLLWRHDLSGEAVAWHMNGAVFGSHSIVSPPAFLDAGWRIAGTHDFDGDRETDLLGRHQVTGELAIAYLQGATVVDRRFLTPFALADNRWAVAGTGDFNQDGKPDLVWRHSASGQIVLWHLDGSVLQSGTPTDPPALTDMRWHLVGVADFNRDRAPDLLWRHKASGENAVWFMNGSQMTSGAFTAPRSLPDPDWHIHAVGDYNSDQQPDLVWRHAVSGQIAIWFMNNVAMTSGTFTTPAAVEDAQWRLVGPR